MRIPIITKYLERRSCTHLMQMMRGYRKLRDTGRIGLVTELKEDFANTQLKIGPNGALKLIYGAGCSCAELAVKQYLLTLIAGLKFNKAVLRSFGASGTKLSYPLPLEWRIVAEKHGIKVSKLCTCIIWNGFVVMVWGYGVLSVLRITADSIRKVVIGAAALPDRYVYFDGLASGQLPQSSKDGISYDIISWYLKFPGRITNLDACCHGVQSVVQFSVKTTRVMTLYSPIPPLKNFRKILHFIFWGIYSSVYAFVSLLRGKWYNTILFNEAVKAAQVRLSDPPQLAKEFLFHNSNYMYRPLWTYEAEKLGSKISFYFYSTNCESFKRQNGYPVVQASTWQVMNWPNYLVWDDYQAEFIRRATGSKKNTKVVGPIWFQSSVKELPELPSKSIAVFDVQPARDSFYQGLCADWEYIFPRITNSFLLDIAEVVKKLNGVMVLKRKRHIGRLMHKSYHATFQKVTKQDNVIDIEPDTAAIKVIERCEAVISFPFTSTALLGKSNSKPSAYYDPSGLIQKDDRAAHGIPVLIGKEELRHWLSINIFSNR
jgi:polysaccharide biosynthesis PFTS motif protein